MFVKRLCAFFGCNSFIPLMVHAFLMELVAYSYCERVVLLSGDIELNPGPLKCCPACNAPIYIRKKYCDCEYKRGRPNCPVKDVNVLLSNECKKLAMQRKRQLESEESRYRRECNKTASSKRKASETPQEANKHRKYDKMTKNNKLSETEEQASRGKKINLASKRNRKISESKDAAMLRK